MTEEKFKISKMRTIKSPSGQDITTYVVLVNFKDLPQNLSMEVNPRKPKMNTVVARELIKAVKDESVFDINNRGIVITAESLKFDPNESKVTLNLGDDQQKYGILDGGHTYTAIIENRDDVSEETIKDKFVKVEVIVGTDVNVSDLADARNTSIQVSDIALFELDDKFNFIKKAVRGQEYEEKIAFKDNENKPIPIAEVLKLLFMFNIKRFSDDTVMPIAAYSAKASVFKDYRKEYDKEDNIYIKLAPYIPQFIELYEKILLEIPDKYIEFKKNEGKNGAFGRLRGVEVDEKKLKKYKLPFTNGSAQYDISAGFVLPIFGAFRALLSYNENKDKVIWKYDPKKVWEQAGARLVQNTFDTGNNPQTVGKTRTLWQGNYRLVDGVWKDIKLRELENELNKK